MLGKPKPIKRILLAEDSKEIRIYFERMLNQLFDGVIDIAVDGEQLKNRPRWTKYDAIFTDLYMPKRNADEVFRDHSELFGNIPVFLLTALNEERVDTIREEIRSYGINLVDILVKPVTRHDLGAALAEVI